MLTVLLLVALLAASTLAAERLTEDEKHVLTYLGLRDEPEGREASGPNSFHLVNAAPTKHQPFLSVDRVGDGTASISVRVRGDAPQDKPDSLHPMTSAHFIEAIFVLDSEDRVVFFHQWAAPTPDQPEEPVVQFTVSTVGERLALTPYEFCNLHGLWQGPTLHIGSAVEDALASERATI